MGRWSNNFEPLHNSIASAIGSRQSYLEIPFVISSRGAIYDDARIRFRWTEGSSRLVSPRRPNAFAALSAITRHQRIPPTYPVRVEIIQSRILGVEINRHFWRFRTSLSLLSLSLLKKRDGIGSFKLSNSLGHWCRNTLDGIYMKLSIYVTFFFVLQHQIGLNNENLRMKNH